jgi:carbonic anhydrase
MNSGQSPINLAQTGSKPCDQLCELVFDDAYIQQANVIVSDEGLILQNNAGLGSCKFNGDSYNCQTVVVTHPAHHTIENIQADAEVVAIFSSPTAGMLCVSSLVRVNPYANNSSHFFNAFVPYANPSVPYTSISLGEQWGLFMMVPPTGSYFYYEGSLIVPPCQPTKWVVFKSMINIDSGDFALLAKNVMPGSRPIQALGDRQVYFNDIDQLVGGPMPHDGKTYMRCKRSGKKPEVKDVAQAPLGDKKTDADKKKKWAIQEAVETQIAENGFLSLVDVVLLLLAIGAGIYFGKMTAEGPNGMYLVLTSQWLATYIRSLFGSASDYYERAKVSLQKKKPVAYTSATPSS